MRCIPSCLSRTFHLTNLSTSIYLVICLVVYYHYFSVFFKFKEKTGIKKKQECPCAKISLFSKNYIKYYILVLLYKSYI